MEVYNGPHLTIKHEQESSRLIISWESSPSTDVEYRKELMEHRHVLEKIRPSQVLWLIENLSLQVSDGTQAWVAENISKPLFKAGFTAKRQDGFDKVAFVVGRDVLAHIKVLDMFEVTSLDNFQPKHFATEIEARDWLSEEVAIKGDESEDQKLEITYIGLDDHGRTIMEFKESAAGITSTLKFFKSIIEEHDFMKNNIDRYSSLSPRERETLKFIVKGCTNEQISERMSVSPHTIRTHRNRIWKKLDIKHFKDCLRYQCFFT
ncbi:MAG: DNA-binding CsgD family transcriptional regulator [Bacteroidia bacterium]|jgi:DNA-binding CsgD family transcriptional regulator